MISNCEICNVAAGEAVIRISGYDGSQKITYARLVRDHDHQTGFIRGSLCDKCNSYLGYYDACLLGTRFKLKAKHGKWKNKYKKSIKAYLTKPESGILYV